MADFTGSKYENMDRIASIISIDQRYSVHMDKYFKEMQEHFRRVAGYLYSEADLEKLTLEQRPSYVYNLLLPYILKLAGGFLKNQSRLEAEPQEPGDFGVSQIMTNLLDFSHYTANNLPKALGTSFIFSTIGRVGWIANEWSYHKYKEGMNYIYAENPLTIKWDGGFTQPDLLTTPAILKDAWLRPEDLKRTYGRYDEELMEVIDERCKLFLGEGANKRLASYLERNFGADYSYSGDKKGYDSTSTVMSAMKNGLNTDAFRGTFKVIEAHERKEEVQFTLTDPATLEKYDITKEIDAVSLKKYDNDKLQAILSMYPNGIIENGYEEKIYQCDVCPALNLVLYDEPYAVQNRLFKYNPVFCFDFGTESFEWKSYVDVLKDAATSFVLTQNTVQTYLMKATNGDTYFEDDAFPPEEMENFYSNKPAKKIRLNPGGLAKIDTKAPAPIPAGFLQHMQGQNQLMQEMVGIGNNSKGMQETNNETGVLFAQRVQQSDEMQAWVHANVDNQLKLVGTLTKDILRTYLTPGRVIKIAGDQTDPMWLQINQDNIRKLVYNATDGTQISDETVPGNIFESDYDIVLSKAPFGEFAKQQELDKVMMVAQYLDTKNPAYMPPKVVVKAIGLREQADILQNIDTVDQQTAMLAQQQQAMDEQNMLRSVEKDKIDNRTKELANKGKENELAVDDMMTNVIKQAAGGM
jgi:hypothetical protein